MFVMAHNRKNLQPKWQIFLTIVLVLYMVGWNYNSAAAAGITYYVDNTNVSCSGLGTGLTPTLPFCAISSGVAVATFGDTVRVLAGTYAETVTTVSSGIAGNPITFPAAPGVTVTGAAPNNNGFRMSGRSYIVVDGFTITGTVDYGIYVWGSNNITLSNNHVSYSGSPVSNLTTRSGIYINSTTNSTISGNTSDYNSSHGILTNGSNNNLVSNNVSFANAEQWQRNASGIRLDASTNNTLLHNIAYGNEDSGVINNTGSSGNLIIGNLTYGNGDHGIEFNAAPNNMVIGNTVQGNVTSGINFEGALAPGSGGATVINNIMVDNGLLQQVGGGTASGQSGNLRFDANSLTGNTLDYNIY
jgi:parallel beta-helix repeat protein